MPAKVMVGIKTKARKEIKRMQLSIFNRDSNLSNKSTFVKSVLVAMGVISTALLSGCAGVNGSFACDKTAGDSCQSVSAVNRQADQGAYNADDTTSARTQTQESANTPMPSGMHVSTPSAGDPVRFGESVTRIWIAPFEDTEGNYHEPSYVYTVVNPSHWVGVPDRAINSIEEN